MDAYTIELPAGLIDPNEDPAVAAMREFNEETLLCRKSGKCPPRFLFESWPIK